MLGRFWQDIWITLFIVLILIGIFSGTGVVIAFASMGLLVAGIARLWNRLSLEKVSYERRLSRQRVFPGEEVTLALVVTNGKPVPMPWLRLSDEIPTEIEVIDEGLGSTGNLQSRAIRHEASLGWYERIRWEHRIRCFRRGYYRMGPVRIATGDLFGFYENRMVVEKQDYLLVYPRVVPLEELLVPGARPLGEVKDGSRIFQDRTRPSGVREYQRGDPLNIVDWKATAKRDRLQVRTFDPSSSITIILAVAIETTAHHWEGFSSEYLERVITAAASVATYAIEHEYSLGLFANGTPVLSDRPMRIPPSRDPGHLGVVLEALASINPVAVGSMANQLAQHASQFPMGATIVLAAAIVSPELVEVLRTLKGRGFGVVMMYAGDQPCPPLPPGVAVHEVGAIFASEERSGEPVPG